MSSFSEIVKNRRSVRKFTGEKLNPEEINSIMKTALSAPSSRHKESWEFVLVDDKRILNDLSGMKPSGGDFIKDCALAVVILSDKTKTDSYIEDASIASAFIQLAAEDLGLGSCWVQVRGYRYDEKSSSEEFIRALLDIPSDYHIDNIIALGHKVKKTEPRKESELDWGKVHYDRY